MITTALLFFPLVIGIALFFIKGEKVKHIAFGASLVELILGLVAFCQFDKKQVLPNVGVDPNYRILFSVQSVDPTTNMLDLYFEKSWKARRTQMTFSDFINLMNNTRLFNFGDIFD